MTRERAHRLRALILKAAESLADGDALDGVELFPNWEPGRACGSGERLRYHGELYRVLQDHTAQADWTPDAAPSLFVRVSEPGTIPEWVQPLGAEDAYRKGDKVRHTEKIWTSDIDANVWEPGVYGWTGQRERK